MKNIIRTFLITYLSISSICAISQNYITIKGVVIDKGTNQKISFATISISNTSIGVISNENGEFIFKIPNIHITENLCISMLGYNTYTKKISDFSENSYYTIKLESKEYNLQEVTIEGKRKHLNAAKIVQLAIDSIKVNYPTNPFILQGYYREYVKQGDKKYLNLLEAAIVLKDKGFNTNFFPYQAYLLQMRFNNGYEFDKDFQAKYSNTSTINMDENIKYMPGHTMPIIGGNELSILFAHDAIRRNTEQTYNYIYQFNKDFISNHSFLLDSIFYQDDIPIYCISFQYNYNTVYKNHNLVDESDIRGRIFIRSNTYAIERLEYTSYSLENKGMKNFEIIADYKIRNEKMYLNYLSFSNFFKEVISPKNYSQYDITYEKQPLQIKDIMVEENSLILTFNKKINKLSAFNKKNYKLNGYIIKNNFKSLKQDTIYLPKYPEKVSITDNTIKIIIDNIESILEKDDNISVTKFGKLRGVSFLIDDKIPATIDNNVISCKNMSLTITGVSDAYGNRFNALCTLDMYQFREFFVNDILKYNYSTPQTAVSINNNFPIYYQMPKAIDDFWNNFNYPITTPLLDNLDTSSK
jgi:hypothetical protein